MLRIARRVPASALFAQTDAGTYYRWQAGGGAELWLGLGPDQGLKSVVPHFAPAVRTRVRLVERIPSAEHELDGAMLLVVAPRPIDPGGDPLAGAFPLVVDVPDFRRLDALMLPLELDMSIGAVAERLEHYATEADLRASGLEAELETLVPSGLVTSEGKARDPRRAEATILGTVLASGMRTNAVGVAPFTWARVRTAGVELEIVADPVLLARPPVAGSILAGTFWITALVSTAWPDPITGRT
jgi:hypothetical protein